MKDEEILLEEALAESVFDIPPHDGCDENDTCCHFIWCEKHPVTCFEEH